MKRKATGRKALTSTERGRLFRLRKTSVESQTNRVITAFEAVSEDTRWSFIRWLRKKHFLR